MEQKSISGEFVKRKILNQEVLVKSIRSQANDSRYWQHLIDQLKHPESYRPIKPIREEIDKDYIYNAQTQTWHHRNVSNKRRGEPKNTSFTKKTATSLLPPNGNMTLFRHGLGEHIGLMFDIEHCKIKDKYVFERNIDSDKKPWLGKKNPLLQNIDPLPKSIALENLREKNKDTKSILSHNELLASLSKAAVLGIFCAEDNLTHRVGAKALQTFVSQELQIDIPIFIIIPGFDTIEYTPEEQDKDLQAASLLAHHHPAYLYVQQTQKFLRHEQKSLVVPSQTNNASTLPALHSNIIEYITTFFTYNEKQRLARWRYKKNMRHAISMLPTFVQQILKSMQDSEKKQNKPSVLNKPAISKAECDIEKAMSSSAHYRKYQEVTNKTIELMCKANAHTAVEFFLKCLHAERYLSPLLRHFIGQDILFNLTKDQINDFVCAMISFSDKNNFSLIDEVISYVAFRIPEREYKIEFNLKDLYQEIVISKEHTRSINNETVYESDEVSRQKLCLMTIAALYNPQLCELIHQRDSTLIFSALETIKNLYIFIKKYSQPGYYSDMTSGMKKISTNSLDQAMLEKAHLRLLLLIDKNYLSYHFSEHEKRLLEKHYLQKISEPGDKNIEKLMKSPSVTSHRHEKYDAFCRFFFGTHKETTMQRNLMQALEIKKSALALKN